MFRQQNIAPECVVRLDAGRLHPGTMRAGADMFEGRVLTPGLAGNNRCEQRERSVPDVATATWHSCRSPDG